MGIQFSGIASGLPVNDIISQLLAVESRPIELLMQRKDTLSAQQSQYTAVSSRITTLRDSIRKITDSHLGASFDLFQGKAATSSNTNMVTVSTTNSAAQGSFTVEVVNLATATRATSLQTIGNFTTTASALNTVSEGSVTSGDFTIFVNNQARTISVDKDVDTIDDVLNRIEAEITAVAGGAANGVINPATGQIELTYAAGTTVRFGATGDTSNFAKVMHLATGSENVAQDTFTAKYGTSTIDKEGTLIGNAVGFQNNTIAAGTFTIGGASFTIDGSTTLTGLLSDINNDSDAGVLLSYNTISNQFEMTSKETGNQAITLDDGGTGFLESIGLVSGLDSLSSQTLGNNAQLKINGGAVLESVSNTVDSSVTGLTGITLNLLSETGAGTPATIDVKQDTDKLKSAINDFITKFNSAISFIDEQTKRDTASGKSGVLSGESGLKRFRNELRTQISDGIPTLDVYNSLSQIGITTGAVTTSTGNGPSSTFTLNEATFLAALADDPEGVKELLIGDGTNDGILNKLEDRIASSLDPEFGIFSSRNKSASAQIKALNDAIAKSEARLEVRERQLRAQFTAMEKLVSSFQQQQSALTAFANRNSSS